MSIFSCDLVFTELSNGQSSISLLPFIICCKAFVVFSIEIQGQQNQKVINSSSEFPSNLASTKSGHGKEIPDMLGIERSGVKKSPFVKKNQCFANPLPASTGNHCLLISLSATVKDPCKSPGFQNNGGPNAGYAQRRGRGADVNGPCNQVTSARRP